VDIKELVIILYKKLGLKTINMNNNKDDFRLSPIIFRDTIKKTI